eukprot:947146-Pyramimonas_sp.AAC.1
MRPPDNHWHTPHALRGPWGSSFECGAYIDGTHNCIRLGLSPGESFNVPRLGCKFKVFCLQAT